jgi:N-methylhydantoinase A
VTDLSQTCVLGVDIGGTFTDVVLASPGVPLLTGKYLTTSGDVTEAVLTGIDDVLHRAAVRPEQVARVVHATTLATNTILERRGAEVAFVTTRGFRDLLALGRQARVEEDRYDLMADGAEIPVPLSHTFEVSERIGAGGEVLQPFDEADAEAVADRIAALGVQAVAICFLHSFANPDHEQRMAAICAKRLAGAAGEPPLIVCSHDIWPELREYERATTTLMSAYVGPIMAGYLRDLQTRLGLAGIHAPLHIMDSSGGVMSAQRAASVAVRTLESGPAAGVVAARQVGLAAGFHDLLAFDMGGTTAKAGIVRGGKTGITRDFQVGGKGSFGGRRAGTGLPVKVPAVDLAEVGSGGGSIAWVDDAGALRVGPRSSGSHPGPACYGFGGTAATVSDADLVLGYLDPDGFAGGTMRLQRELAEQALDELAAQLSTDRLRTAHAIAQIANASMGFAVQVVTVQRGIDPRRFAMVASGGAGPMHAARIAERFGIRSVLVPFGSGVGSAVGLLDCDLATERAQALPRPLLLSSAGEQLDLLRQSFGRLERAARAELAEEASGPGLGSLTVAREVDLRYRGQAFELTVPVPSEGLGAAALPVLASTFHEAYASSYGSHLEGPLELVSLRVRVTIEVPRIPRGDAAADGDPLLGSRPVSFVATEGYVPTPVYLRDRMPLGFTCPGPAVIAEAGSTAVVPPGWTARMEGLGTLLLVRDPS